jgi:hypothetical protein
MAMMAARKRARYDKKKKESLLDCEFVNEMELDKLI